MKFWKTLATSLAGCVVATIAFADARVALVIGNSDYQHAQALRNPENDALAMAAQFRELGFETIEGYDLDYDGMRATMREFARSARDAELTVIFYAGHGIAVNGENYMVPVDARLDDPVDWEFQVFPLEDFMRLFRHSSGANLVFLDACRDNPLAEVLASSMGTTTRTLGSRGLARVDIETDGAGTAIAFATSPGEVAEDGMENNSPFTTALLNHIATPNSDITEVMSLVTGEVYEATEQRQRPWLNASLTGPVVLNPVDIPEPQQVASVASDGVAAPAPSASGNAQHEAIIFEAAQTSGDARDYQYYLDLFPTGIYAQLARNAIARIEEEQAPAEEEVMQVASNETASTAVVPTRNLQAPLVLDITPALMQSVSNQQTETALALDNTQRRGVQLRLNLAGFNVGTVDGAWGNMTRTGLRSWQTSNGLIATGFLNDVQLQLLTAQTEAAFQSQLASNPNALQPAYSGGGSSSGGRTSSGGGNGNGLGGFVGGLITGIAISR